MFLEIREKNQFVSGLYLQDKFFRIAVWPDFRLSQTFFIEENEVCIV